MIANSLERPAFVSKLRERLRAQASELRRGDYPDPIGSGKTPSIATLRARASHMTIAYADIPRGGEIRFVSKDAALIAALHDWMAATVRVNQKEHPGGGPGEGGE